MAKTEVDLVGWARAILDERTDFSAVLFGASIGLIWFQSVLLKLSLAAHDKIPHDEAIQWNMDKIAEWAVAQQSREGVARFILGLGDFNKDMHQCIDLSSEEEIKDVTENIIESIRRHDKPQ